MGRAGRPALAVLVVSGAVGYRRRHGRRVAYCRGRVRALRRRAPALLLTAPRAAADQPDLCASGAALSPQADRTDRRLTAARNP
jgi:hypothetical protein